MKLYPNDRNPSPPPTLIKRYSAATLSDDITLIEQRGPPLYVGIATEREKHVHQRTVASLRKLAKTKPSSCIQGMSYDDTLREGLNNDTRNAFQCSKLYVLRKSPACIVWPKRPEGPDVEELAPEDLESSTQASIDSSDPRISQGEEMTGRMTKEVNWTGKHKQQYKGSDDKLVTKGSRGRGSQSLGEEEEEEEEAMSEVGKRSSNSSFWDHAYGNIRVDAIYLGSPRRDPYHSTWTRDQRRCFFMSDFVPYHRRMCLPKVVEKKDGGRDGWMSIGRRLSQRSRTMLRDVDETNEDMFSTKW